MENGFDEDRCIGPWYFTEDEIDNINKYYKAANRENLVNPLVDKLLYYMRQDVFRRNPSAMFKPEDPNKRESGITMSEIRRRIKSGEGVEKILNIEPLDWKPADAEEKPVSGTEQ